MGKHGMYGFVFAHFIFISIHVVLGSYIVE